MNSAFALPFQGPPVRKQTEAEAAAEFEAEVAAHDAQLQDVLDLDEPGHAPALRMSKGAKAAAAADGIFDDAIRAAIAEPDEVEPDPEGDGRMRLRRGSLRLVVARDGAVLSVRDRKGRGRG